MIARGSVAVLIWGIHAARFAQRLRLNPSVGHKVLTRYGALRVDQAGDQVRAGGKPKAHASKPHPAKASDGDYCCAVTEAQRGATSLIRKTGGLTFRHDVRRVRDRPRHW